MTYRCIECKEKIKDFSRKKVVDNFKYDDIIKKTVNFVCPHCNGELREEENAR